MVEGKVWRTPRWETEAMPRRSPGRSMKVIVAAATCALFLVKVVTVVTVITVVGGGRGGGCGGKEGRDAVVTVLL